MDVCLLCWCWCDVDCIEYVEFGFVCVLGGCGVFVCMLDLVVVFGLLCWWFWFVVYCVWLLV